MELTWWEFHSSSLFDRLFTKRLKHNKDVVSVYKAVHQEKYFSIKIIIISAETLIFDQLCNLFCSETLQIS